MMATAKRRVEVFTAGCPVCEETVRLVKATACPSCEVAVYDLREGCATNECREKATRYGVSAVPAVAVNGVLLDCCRRGPIDAATLRAAGIGQT
jgi:glutaredoxin